MKKQRKKIRPAKDKSWGKIQKRKNGSLADEEKIIARAKDLIEPLCSAEGLELVHLEYQRETGGRTLRLYIDKPGGVTLDDCVAISRHSSDLLDVYLEKTGPYRLEVSSPGPRRPLAKMTDFDKFKGNRIQIRTNRPMKGKNKHKGILLGISKDLVKLSVDDQTVAIPYTEIVSARLVSSGHQ